MRRLTGLLAAAVLLAAGCGDDGGVPAAQRERLAARIYEAREAAGARDADGVRRALASFRASVRSARERGEIAPENAERLIDQALAASRRARAEITPEPTPEPTPTAVPTEPPPAEEDEERGEGDGKGKGKAKGKADEGDD